MLNSSISACQLYFSEHITDATCIYSSLSMSNLLNMQILNTCTHNVSLYTNITDQWARSRSPTMLSISLVLYALKIELEGMAVHACIMYVHTCTICMQPCGASQCRLGDGEKAWLVRTCTYTYTRDLQYLSCTHIGYLCM